MTLIFIASRLATPQEEASFDFYISPTGSDSNDGSEGSPWAFTALNTKRALYSPTAMTKDMSIGMLPGTYNVASLLTSDRDIPGVDIEGGTSSFRVSIESTTPRAAILNLKNGATYGNAADTRNSIIGHTPSRRQGYITIDGIRITGGRTNILEIGIYAASDNIPGIIIQNCEIDDYNDVGSTPGGGNCSGITLNHTLGATITNNYIHDGVGHQGSADHDHLSSILLWGCPNTLVEKNTIINAGAIYQKEMGFRGNGGAIVRQNYIDNTRMTNCVGIYDFATPTVNASATGGTRVYNNIVISAQPIVLVATIDRTDVPDELLECYNNTLVIEPFAAAGNLFQGQTSGLKYYNNIVALTGGANPSDIGFAMFRDGTLSVLDFNIYPASNQKWSWYVTDPGVRDGTTSFATYKSHWSAISGDANSLTTDTPGFTGSGSLAAFYNVTSGTAFQAGHVGGVSGGATRNIGAWDGVVTQIGCDF